MKKAASETNENREARRKRKPHFKRKFQVIGRVLSKEERERIRKYKLANLYYKELSANRALVYRLRQMRKKEKESKKKIHL